MSNWCHIPNVGLTDNWCYTETWAITAITNITGYEITRCIAVPHFCVVVRCLIDLKKTSEDHDLLFEIFVHRIPRQLVFLWFLFFVSLIPDEHRDIILLLAWPLASYSLYCYYPLQTHRALSGVNGNDEDARDYVFGLAL